jgi:hypothetical protein
LRCASKIKLNKTTSAAAKKLRGVKSNRPRVKPASASRMNQRKPDIDEAEDVSARDVDEFDFYADEVKVETYQPVSKPNATASLKVSRRAAKLDAKSELAKSPLFARASVLAKKTNSLASKLFTGVRRLT